MEKKIIRNIQIVNENQIFSKDILIVGEKIEKIENQISLEADHQEINGEGLLLIPGLIDDQVHFREPGLTHKANIYSESRAAVAGGVTSFMEMPNTNPPAFTNSLLEEKFAIAQENSLANYSFFLGTSNDNLDEIKKVNVKNVCGVKIFMGSSTGNLLVDNESVLESIFKECPTLIATHCEDEMTIKNNFAAFEKKYGEDIPMHAHPLIRNHEACYLSSSKAVKLAKRNHTRLHILHISTADEVALFDNKTALKDKKITAEACVHHLWFDDRDYEKYGSLIKCNPAIKSENDKNAILKAVLDNHIDIIATDHAPHTWEEKQNLYKNAPSGVPLVQHSLQMMLEFYKEGKIDIEKIVEKMCHAPADCFRIQNRGYIREGYFADMVLVDLNQSQKVEKDNIYYKCGWSPFEHQSFSSSIIATYVNGNIVFSQGNFYETIKGKRLAFDR